MKIQSKNLLNSFISITLSIILAAFSFTIFLNLFDASYLYYCLNIGWGQFNVMYVPSPECAALWKSTQILGKVITLIGVILFSAFWYVLLNTVFSKIFRIK